MHRRKNPNGNSLAGVCVRSVYAFLLAVTNTIYDKSKCYQLNCDIYLAASMATWKNVQSYDQIEDQPTSYEKRRTPISQ